MGGKEKTSTTNVVNQTSTPTPTEEERQFNQLQLQDYQTAQPFAQQVNRSGLNLSNLLLTGQELPGYLKSLPGGISEDVTGSIVNQSLKDMNSQLAKSGAGTFMESGASQAIGVRASADTRNQATQFNLQNLQQLINLAVGGQAVPLGYNTDMSAQLSGRMVGLRSVNTTGTNQSTTLGMNPFMKSFQTSAGQAYGNPFQSFGQATGGFK